MKRKISRSQVAGINIRKNLQALISVKVTLETAPTNGKLKCDNKSNYSNNSCNNHDNNNE